MMTLTDISKWSFEQASTLLPPLGNRWLHVQGVVKRAEYVGKLFNENNKSLLIAAAYLHDIGYAPSLAKTGFHPLDGANYLKSQGYHHLASLVAYHSESQFEAHLRGLDLQLEQFSREYSSIADALTYCDMITNSCGKEVTFQERIDDIFSRYNEEHIIHHAIKQALPSLLEDVTRTQKLLQQHELKTQATD